MRRLIVLLLLLPFGAFSAQYVINRRNNTTVDVSSRGKTLKVVCRFPAYVKFDKAINAKLDDQKSQTLLAEGLIRYFNVGTNETIEVLGRHILGVEKDGDYLSYSFSVPEGGCKVVPKRVATNAVRRMTASTPGLQSILTNRPAMVKSVSMPGIMNSVAAVKPLPILTIANPVVAVKTVPVAGITNQSATVDHFTNTTIKTVKGGK